MLIKKIKIFRGNGSSVEDQYNYWLTEYPNITIMNTQINVFFKGSEQELILTIFYEYWEDSYEC